MAERHPQVRRYERHSQAQVHDFFLHVMGHRQTLTLWMLWVTDKPSSLHGAPLHTSKPPLDLLPTLTTHTWFKSMEHQAVVSQARHRNLPQAVRPLCTPLPTVLSRCSPCFASAPCLTARPSVLVFLNLVWPLSIKLVSPPDHPQAA